MGVYTEIITDWMIRCHVIKESEEELYTYALYSFTLLLLPIILAGGIGFLLGNMTRGIVFILPFVILRKYCGGFHAKYLWKCVLLSSLLLSLCLIVSMYIECDSKLATATIVAAVCLIIFSPIDNESRRLNESEKCRYKKTLICLVVFFLLSDICLFLLNLYSYVICFSIGLQLVAGLQMPCIITGMLKKTKNN